MDFLKVIRSLEELLYEVMTWLVFSPRTMARIVIHPEAATRYSEHELGDAAAEQYTDSLSPPLLLMLTLLIAHGFELGTGLRMPETGSEIGKALLGSAQGLLMLRAILFSIFPLVAATTLIGRRKLALDRKSLRGPFFSQCFLAAPFVLALSLAGNLARMSSAAAHAAAAALAVAGTAWYFWAETAWFRRQLGVGTGRAFLVTAWSVVKATFFCLVAAVGVALVMLVG